MNLSPEAEERIKNERKRDCVIFILGAAFCIAGALTLDRLIFRPVTAKIVAHKAAYSARLESCERALIVSGVAQ